MCMCVCNDPLTHVNSDRGNVSKDHARHTKTQHHPNCTQPNKSQLVTVSSSSARSKVTLLTSNAISRTFLGICMMPESPSSPDTHTQGLEVVMALLSFLMGMMTTLYGITAGGREGGDTTRQQQNREINTNMLIRL